MIARLRICTTGFNEGHIARCPPGDGIFRSRTGGSARWPLPRPQRTAPKANQPLGSAEVIHPFHPLRGQRFVVLKVRRVSGVETLSLRHADLGSFAMPRDWTDWARPEAQASATNVPLLMDAFGLVALAELIEALAHDQSGVDQ